MAMDSALVLVTDSAKEPASVMVTATGWVTAMVMGSESEWALDHPAAIQTHRYPFHRHCSSPPHRQTCARRPGADPCRACHSMRPTTSLYRSQGYRVEAQWFASDHRCPSVPTDRTSDRAAHHSNLPDRC